jgi:hypothetical protein
VALGALVIATPAHRMLYGVVALAVAVYSIVEVNLGGFLVGFLLAAVGGILTVSWMPRSEVRKVRATRRAGRRSGAMTIAGRGRLRAPRHSSRRDASSAHRPVGRRGRPGIPRRRRAPGGVLHPDHPALPRRGPGTRAVPVSVRLTVVDAWRPPRPDRGPRLAAAGRDDAAVAPVADDGAPVFTQPSAQLGSKSLSFQG